MQIFINSLAMLFIMVLDESQGDIIIKLKMLVITLILFL